MELSIEELKCCPICYDSRATIYVDRINPRRFLCDCCVCGRFISNADIDFRNLYSGYNIDEVASFMFYNGERAINDRNVLDSNILSFDGGMIDCPKFYENLDPSNVPNFHCLPVNAQVIKNWMPKSFSGKIDYILSYLANKTNRYGESLFFYENELVSLFFLKRHELIHGCSFEPLPIDELHRQLQFIVEWIEKENYLSFQRDRTDINVKFSKSVYYWEHEPDLLMFTFRCLLTPNGYKRVDYIEKHDEASKDVFIAMKFGEETTRLRECIKDGIYRAGYNPILIDEIEHNDQIMPELLYRIRQSRFLVADLTYDNSGVYFEAGYALGYGKNVIQLCKRGERMHFDRSQVNTIIWDNEEEIPQRLCNRIKATID